MNALFVYGTLRQGFPNEHILTQIQGTFQNANVRGHYVNSGWGAELGCPALKLDADGETIEGQVFTSENLKHHWQTLDEFEGAEYCRVITQVTLNNGNKVDAYVYVESAE